MGRHSDTAKGREDDWEVGDPDATDPDTWTGVTRDVLMLPIKPAEGGSDD